MFATCIEFVKLPLVEKIGDTELFDSLEVVYFDEQRSVEELRMMLKD